MDVILLGEIEDKLSELNSSLSGKIDTVKTEVGSVKSLVTTNNTANKTGILSQKLSYLIAQNENHGSLERTTAGSQNWTCPSGVYQVLICITGGGGGGAGGGAGGADYYGGGLNGGAGGSGSNGDKICVLISVIPGTTYTLTVGGGGTGGSGGGLTGSGNAAIDGAAGTKGGDGENSLFSTIITAYGGKGGTGGSGGGTVQYEGGNGGNGGTLPSVIKISTKFAYILDNVRGKSGNAGTKHGTAATTGVSNRLESSVNNFSGGNSGAGGAGGVGSKNGTRTAGSNGSTGGSGSILIWY